MTVVARMLVGVLGLLTFFACRASIGTETQTAPAPVNSAENECREPLERACKGGTCPTWEEEKADVKALAKQVGSRCSGADSGTCGGYLYVKFEDSWGSRISYFDRTGKLIGLKRTQDAAFEPCFGTFRYGKEIQCSPAVRENYCRQ